MKKFLLFLMVFLLATVAQGITDIGRRDSGAPPLTTAEFSTSTSAGTYLIGKAYRNATVRLEHNGGLTGTLYGCDVQDYVAASCDSLTTIDADLVDVPISTGRRYYIAVTTGVPSATAYITFKGSYTSAAVDPSYTVRFESAATTDDPMVYAFTPVHVKKLCCYATGSPSDHIVYVRKCSVNGISCEDTGLEVTLVTATTVCDATTTAADIPQDTMWGIHTKSRTAPATVADCSVSAERG